MEKAAEVVEVAVIILLEAEEVVLVTEQRLAVQEVLVVMVLMESILEQELLG